MQSLNKKWKWTRVFLLGGSSANRNEFLFYSVGLWFKKKSTLCIAHYNQSRFNPVLTSLRLYWVGALSYYWVVWAKMISIKILLVKLNKSVMFSTCFMWTCQEHWKVPGPTKEQTRSDLISLTISGQFYSKSDKEFIEHIKWASGTAKYSFHPWKFPACTMLGYKSIRNMVEH